MSENTLKSRTNEEASHDLLSVTETMSTLLESLTATERTAQERIKKLEAETESLSRYLANSYEEIALLHRLTKNLRISQSDEALARVVLDGLTEVVPAEYLAVELLAVDPDNSATARPARNTPIVLWNCAKTSGKASPEPLSLARFEALLQHVAREAANRPILLNRDGNEDAGDWPFPEVRQLIAVPLAEGDNLFGWLVALNHTENGQFGSVEASLLSSVAAILGIHSGNLDLYRQQAEMFAGVVRALTSALDAKDQYTHGHSDRVAQIAVRLAQELGCEPKLIDTIYLGGLLHDVGKIGVDDAVLRKPGKLTPEEYEHIKRHPVIGHKILVDLKKLDEVLPAVLHHHEAWDGSGYPAQLAGDSIPRLARIMAVADSYDAMGSDRPYRNHMPDEKIDEIIRKGASQQWDPEVVAAFFRIREDLRRLVCRDEAGEEVASG